MSEYDCNEGVTETRHLSEREQARSTLQWHLSEREQAGISDCWQVLLWTAIMNTEEKNISNKINDCGVDMILVF